MTGSMLHIAERAIRCQGPGNVLAVCWRQWRLERRLARREVQFRETNAMVVGQAYAAMSAEEFAAINARQKWANWRTIPRCLNGHVPDRPLRVLDLGCGSGCSTQVLAYWCLAGSYITEYELAEPLLNLAGQHRYRHRRGQDAKVDFCCQGVTTTLPVPDHSADLVNASGVVGQHLDQGTIAPLVKELPRLLVPGGVVQLDVGPTLSAKELKRILTAASFQVLGHYRSWLFDPTGQVVFRWPGEDWHFPLPNRISSF